MGCGDDQIFVHPHNNACVVNRYYIQPMNQKMFITLLLGLICVLHVQAWTQAADQDKVTQLDGYLNFTGSFQMFSGYVDISQSPLIRAHYIFVTSQTNPDHDDVVLWLNGGPGCSSLLGFATEVGPNVMPSGSKSFSSYINPYSWNKNANLLFFQSPPGVGFSINQDDSYVYNESRTASDSVAALKAWYQKFPEFLGNNFWIAGQSYCGMYIPNFASQLIDANDEWDETNTTINFKGVMIGNGVMLTDRHWRRQARNTFYSKHYFYGPEINDLIQNCEYDSSDDFNPSCIRGNQMADRSVQMVNPYATIGICYTPSTVDPKKRRFWYTPFFEQNNPIMGEVASSSGAPCTDDVGITEYFNRQKVKQQLHVDTSIEWESCNQDIGENYHKDPSSIEIFSKLKQNNIRILLFSGNTDAVVSYVETEEYIKKIGWAQKKQKTAFLNQKDSLLGWWTEYDGLSLAIINGAGHMVPADKPNAAYHMFSDFISRK